MFRENFEPDIYRDNLAEEIKEAPKEERQEILDKAKETPEYQIARNKKIESRQNEEEIDDGLGVFLKKKTLYHGTSAKGIKKFEKAEETTVGDGVYLTSKAKDAIGYAIERAKAPRGSKRTRADGDLIIYETFIENLKIIDLRSNENVGKILLGFKPVLQKRREEIILEEQKEKINRARALALDGYRNVLDEALDSINSGDTGISKIRQVTLHIEAGLFTKYLKSLGYDGLIIIEGGEGEHKGNHDSYVIFDPEKVKIIREQKIK